jgi:glyoxylase-like metal-dependent hydrolase (beta-lactamase superfamily II)
MADLKIGRMVLGMCQTNCYFVYREGSSKVIFIDPADYGEQIFKAMKDNGFEVAAILLTHGHFDHIWGCSRLRQLTSAPVYAYEGEEKVLLSADLNVSADAGRACTVKANTLLKDGEEVTVEGMTFKLIATPGHTQGSCCYYFEEANMLISGDTLFEESVGRTDLPTGSGGTLGRSIKERLLCLPGETTVYPGHGDSTTISYEAKYNPFC